MIQSISSDYEMDFLVRFWELIQKYINEINRCFDEKQCFEMMIMRLCYVSLIPTPFELLRDQELIIKKGEGQDNKLPSNVSNEYEKKNFEIGDSKVQSVNNLAIDKKPKINTENDNQKSEKKSNLSKFKSIVDKIEMNSEMQIAYHLKNSFR